MPLFGESLFIGCLVCFMGSVSLLGDCGIGSKCDLHVGLFKKKKNLFGKFDAVQKDSVILLK